VTRRSTDPHNPRTREDWLARAELMEERAKAMGSGMIAEESYRRSAEWARQQAAKAKS
jgi:hypothetical protein